MRARWQLALGGIAFIWGATFIVVQAAIEQVPVLRFLAVRFAVAALVMIAFGGLRGMRTREFWPGGIAGLALLAGYVFQTEGLRHTTASNAGFITGMFVVLTPLFMAIAYRRLPPRASLAGAGIAAIGLYLLAAPGRIGLSYGDSLQLLCAASFAAHIVVLGHFAKRMPTFRFATIQVAVVAIGTGVASTVIDTGPMFAFDAGVWGAVALTALGGTALAFYVQARAQRMVPPTRTAIILTLEPVFAGVFGAIAGDRIGLRGFGGAALILGGILIAELRARADRALADPLTAPA